MEGGGRVRCENTAGGRIGSTDVSQDATQYEAAARKRTLAAAALIFILIPATIIAGALIFDQNMYMPVSLLIIIYTLIPFFMIYEKRKPKAREVVLIAMMSAITTVIHMFFHITVPIQAGTALVIISGIALGPEAGFLVGALSRFVCNFYMGQGPWTPWQMFCWGILGFLGGVAFNRIRSGRKYGSEKKRLIEIGSGSISAVAGPMMCLVFSIILAYVSFMILPGEDETFFGWRLYVFGAAGLLAGVLLQRKRLPADNLTLALFTFFTTFVVYGGLMNICAMITASPLEGGDPVSFKTLRTLYIAGVPYDAVHAVTAAIFVFIFGGVFIKKLDRIIIKYGIYR